MAKSARSEKLLATPQKAPPLIINEGLTKRLAMADQATGPVRTLIFIEIGDIDPKTSREAVGQIAATYQGQHPTYICPTRGGKVRSFPIFEEKILEWVKTFCEVKDGEIKLKGEEMQSVNARAFYL